MTEFVIFGEHVGRTFGMHEWNLTCRAAASSEVRAFH